jgi:hypothetical protein
MELSIPYYRVVCNTYFLRFNKIKSRGMGTTVHSPTLYLVRSCPYLLVQFGKKELATIFADWPRVALLYGRK